LCTSCGGSRVHRQASRGWDVSACSASAPWGLCNRRGWLGARSPAAASARCACGRCSPVSSASL
jgi:hypothetical protein